MFGSWIHLAALLSLGATHGYKITPAEDYLVGGWGKPHKALVNRFKDLKRKAPSRWCRSEQMATTCLEFQDDKLSSIEMTFQDHVDFLKMNTTKYGEPQSTSTAFTSVTYTWTTPKFILGLKQMADASGGVVAAGTWTESMTWKPPAVAAPDGGVLDAGSSHP